MVDLITLTLNHGVFAVRAASTLAGAEAILRGLVPPTSPVIDMDHDDSTALLGRIGASNGLTRVPTPCPGALTRRGDLRTKLAAFDLGVDDILTDALLARGAAGPLDRDHPASVGGPTARSSPRSGSARWRSTSSTGRSGRGTRSSDLSGIEQSLLYLLASRGGRVVSREDILDAIWGTDFVAESNIVDRHIRSLRIKLQNDYRHPRFIATIPGQDC